MLQDRPGLEALNRQPVSPDVLARLAHAVPHPSFALAPLAATVLTQLADQSAEIGQRAARLLDLATRLADLPRWDEGVAAIEEAVAIRRRQVETSPDAFLPDLALTLNNQTAILGALKRWDEALAATDEAVAIRRDSPLDRPEGIYSSLKERCRVKGCFGGVLAAWRACVTGVSCFPDSCHVRGWWSGGSRTGRSPAAVAAPEASLT